MKRLIVSLLLVAGLTAFAHAANRGVIAGANIVPASGGGGGGGNILVGRSSAATTSSTLWNPNDYVTLGNCGWFGYTATNTGTPATAEVYMKSDSNATIQVGLMDASGALLCSSNQVAINSTIKHTTFTFTGCPTVNAGTRYEVGVVGNNYFTLYNDAAQGWLLDTSVTLGSLPSQFTIADCGTSNGGPVYLNVKD